MDDVDSFEIDDKIHMVELCGPADEFLAVLENRLGCDLIASGNRIYIKGDRETRIQCLQIFERLAGRIATGHQLSQADVEREIRYTGHFEPNAPGRRPKPPLARPAGEAGSPALKVGKHNIYARTPAQASYLEALRRYDLVFGMGPAGTGKTFLAVAVGVELLQLQQVRRLILTRPAVEAGENLGFLPGTLEEKVDPYLRPLLDSLERLMSTKTVAQSRQFGSIEVAPLAYMRGRTLDDAYVILDEGQNATSMQMKMFLTRLGENSRMVVTGDPSQVDLPPNVESGLSAAARILRDLPEIGFCRFAEEDVVRHPLVGQIVRAYRDEAERKQQVREDGRAILSPPAGPKPVTGQ